MKVLFKFVVICYFMFKFIYLKKKINVTVSSYESYVYLLSSYTHQVILTIIPGTHSTVKPLNNEHSLTTASHATLHIHMQWFSH